LKAGRKFSFEIKKDETQIIVWNYLSTMAWQWFFLNGRLFAKHSADTACYWLVLLAVFWWTIERG